MASPVDAGRATSSGSGNGTVTLPASIAAGDTIVIWLLINNDTVATRDNSYTEIVHYSQLVNSNFQCQAYVYHKIAAGGETTFTFTETAGAKKWAAVAYRITGGSSSTNPTASTLTNSGTTSNAPDPPSFSPTGGSSDYLFIWLGACDGTPTMPPSGSPTNYSNPAGAATVAGGAAGSKANAFTASRQLTTATEDPPSWTLSAAVEWTSAVIAVYPSTNIFTDAATELFDLQPSGTEGGPYGDTGTAALLFGISATEAAQFADSSIDILALVPSATEEHTTFDAGTAPLVLTPSGSDTYTPNVGVDYTDSATAVLSLVPSSAENTEFVDSDSAQIALTPSSDEVHEIYDADTASIILTPSGTEFVTTTRRRIRVYWAALEVPKPAAVGIYTDSGTAYLSLVPSSVEEYTRYDADTVPLALTASADEIVELTDANTGYLQLAPSSTELYETTDTATEALSLVPSSTDVAQYVDSDTGALALTPSATDTAQYVDSETDILSLVPSSTDTAQYVDSATEPLFLSPSATEFQETTGDQATEYLALVPSASDAAQFVDSGTEAFNLTPSSTELREEYDAATSNVVLTPSVADVTIFVDGATVPFRTTPSSVDTLDFVDSSVEVLSLRPAATDTAQYVDSGTELFTITPSTILEEYGHFDTSTVPVNLVPSGTEEYAATTTDQDTLSLVLTPYADETFGAFHSVTFLLHLTPVTAQEVLILVDLFIKSVSRRFEASAWRRLTSAMLVTRFGGRVFRRLYGSLA